MFMSKAFQRLSRVSLRRSAKSYSTEATFETKPYKLYKLEESPAATVTVTKDEALQMYKQMQTIRKMEATVAALYKDRAIRGYCHLYSGEEACGVGMRASMTGLDSVITTYRCHGWAYLMGISPLQIVSELEGKRSGCSRGKGGSMHMFTRNFYGGNGIVGAQVPLGAGIAFSHKFKGDGGVTLALYGDGAANQGQIFEAFNMSKLWELPIIFVCEDNGYGMGTASERAAANTSYYQRGEYLPGIWVDGMDVLSVREATRFARAFAAEGKGPIVMELRCYRFRGHSTTDPLPAHGRARDEVEEVRKSKDPISTFRKRVVEAGLAGDEEFAAIDAHVGEEIREVAKQSRYEIEPDLNELAADVYCQNLEGPIRGVTSFDTLEHRNVGRRVNMN